jgi:hypothetical protein
MWVDLYNFASLAEHSGIGLWGCKQTSPYWTVECLRDSILTILDEQAGAEIRLTAKRIGDTLRAGLPGREIAAREVAKLAYRK